MVTTRLIRTEGDNLGVYEVRYNGIPKGEAKEVKTPSGTRIEYGSYRYDSIKHLEDCLTKGDIDSLQPISSMKFKTSIDDVLQSLQTDVEASRQRLVRCLGGMGEVNSINDTNRIIAEAALLEKTLQMCHRLKPLAEHPLNTVEEALIVTLRTVRDGEYEAYTKLMKMLYL